MMPQAAQTLCDSPAASARPATLFQSHWSSDGAGTPKARSGSNAVDLTFAVVPPLGRHARSGQGPQSIIRCRYCSALTFVNSSRQSRTPQTSANHGALHWRP